jgi:general stress protein YciG
MSDYTKGQMPLREAARRGGCKARDNGLDYSAIGKVGGSTTRDRHGSEHYSTIGKKGGAAQVAAGFDFAAAGRKGAARFKELIEAGKRVEAEGQG